MLTSPAVGLQADVAAEAQALRARHSRMQQLRDTWQQDMREAKRSEKAGHGRGTVEYLKNVKSELDMEARAYNAAIEDLNDRRRAVKEASRDGKQRRGGVAVGAPAGGAGQPRGTKITIDDRLSVLERKWTSNLAGGY